MSITDFRNVTRSTTRSVRVLSLPTEGLVTGEASVDLAEVEAAEPAEPSPATELPRPPPAVKFPARSVVMCPDRSAGGNQSNN